MLVSEQLHFIAGLFVAVGEPPLCLSYGVVMALRQAITAARNLAGESGWFDISKATRNLSSCFNT